MASLLTNPKLGNTGVSNLIKSASTLANEQSNYNDQIAALQFANSAYTDEAYSSYQGYLQGRINTLSATGSITNASKALTLTKTLEGAMHSNVSASITRENIQIMSGNATLKDKYNLIVNQYQRAFNNGDMTLAQTLMKQAYDVSQTIQYQAQQAADAVAALARSNASSARAAVSANVTDEGQRATNLDDFIKSMAGDFKNVSERQLNAYTAQYVNSPQVKQFLQANGVQVGTSQPNYWDLVYATAGAEYNHLVLKAQAETALNPLLAQNYAMQAHALLTGQTTFKTLAGNLSVQQLQQAQQDPHMFAYDNTTGTYKPTTVIGYQYMNMDNGSGGKSAQLVPTYSGIVGSANSNKIYFLTPQETTTMTKLGLNFADGKLSKTGYAGDGALVQSTQNTPDWLRQILGKNGLANVYTDNEGFITFKAGATKPDGTNNFSSFTLAMDGKGLAGLYEHLPNGESKLVGGDYGFAAQAVQMLINAGQRTQQQIIVAQQQAAAALKVQQVQAQQQLQAQQASAQRALQVQSAPAPAPRGTPPAAQRTYSPQVPNFNPQHNIVAPQAPVGIPGTSTVNPFNRPANPGSIAGTFRL